MKCSDILNGIPWARVTPTGQNSRINFISSNARCCEQENPSTEKAKPTIGRHYFSANKRSEIGDDDHRDVLPHRCLPQFFRLTVSAPEQGAFSDRRKGLSDSQIHGTRKPCQH